MSKNLWQSLYDDILYKSDGKEYVPLPTDTELNSFEERLRIRLPPTYRSFILLFGSGVLAEQYLIFSPECLGNKSFDMTLFNLDFRKDLKNFKVHKGFYNDIEQMNRLVFFSRTQDNDYYAWDSGANPGRKSGELRIHYLRRLDDTTSIIADSFEEFVKRLCLKLPYSTKNTLLKRKAANVDIRRIFNPALLTPYGRKKLIEQNIPVVAQKISLHPKTSNQRHSGNQKKPNHRKALTEAKWLKSKDSILMLNLIQVRASERKLRLFELAYLRRIWKIISPPKLTKAIEITERKVERGVVGIAQLSAAYQSLHNLPYIHSKDGYEEYQPSQLLLDIFGNPFRPVSLNPSWLTSTVLALANSIHEEKAFDRMPILAVALQDAGCDNEDLLNHCRQPGEHVRGCWVVDLLTARS